MAYSEGTATDQFDLLGKIKLFFEDEGWTIESYVTDTSTYQPTWTEGSSNAKRLHVSKSGRCLNFRSTYSAAIIPNYTSRRWGIGFNMGTAYDPSKGWADQPGVARILSLDTEAPAYCWCNGAISYRMFLWDSPFTFLVHIKHSSTMFSQIYFGEISSKYGAWDGGDVFLSSWGENASDLTYTVNGKSFLGPEFSTDGSSSGYYDGALKITTSGIVGSGNPWPTRGPHTYSVDSADSLFIPFMGHAASHGTSDVRRYEWLSNTLGDSLLQAMPSSFMSPIVLLSIQPAIIRSSSPLRYSLLGEFPHMKITAGPLSLQWQIVTYGGTQYILLPMGTPVTYSQGCYINPLLAVEYEGS